MTGRSLRVRQGVEVTNEAIRYLITGWRNKDPTLNGESCKGTAPHQICRPFSSKLRGASATYILLCAGIITLVADPHAELRPTRELGGQFETTMGSIGDSID